MLLKLNHAQVSIPKGDKAEAEARRFYCEVLGLKEIPKPESLRKSGGFWAELGDLQIHFGVEDGFDRRATRSHLAYEVSDLTACKARLAELGIEAKAGIPIAGWDRFEFRAPFGNRVEFLQRVK